ncbi:L-gulonolactone oxidase-like [Actinia tenebrosa]|uniref:L-gulonolactone oxidase-like n=1 Tax=Actinia tenebrosa TaxID=6105 RepID=A0A6P8J4A5_ACTTE|nr:L-gulonolactone oxidase-like [Actinia tenebrosa]
MSNEENEEKQRSVLEQGKFGYKFTNWSKTFSCKPELFFEPRTTEEIKQILLTAKKLKRCVRVCGAGHSPSDIVCTSDFLIDLKKYNQVLKVKIYAFSQTVVSLQLMTAGGVILECSKTKNEEIFHSVLCGLGAFGVILNITWQCEPAFNLHEKTMSCPLDEMLGKLDQELHSCDHFKFFWYPHTDMVNAIYVTRTKEPPTKPKGSWLWDSLFGFYLLEFLYWMSSFFPSMVPFINKLYFNSLFKNSKERIDKSYKILNFNCLFKQYVTEWAVSRDKTAHVLRRLRDWTETSGIYVHFPVEVRFVKSDDIYLSPCYKKDMCFINIICYRPYGKDIPHDKWWSFYENLMTSVGGVPHWAKAHNLTTSHFERLYPMFRKAREICIKLDPDGTFRNQYVNRVMFESV